MTVRPILEIGGTHVTAAAIDTASWSVQTQTRSDIDSAGSAGEIFRAFTEAARSITSGPPTRWGIAIPGPFDYQNGIGKFGGAEKFGALHGVDLATELRARMPELADDFIFVNDADAFAMGEWTALDPSVKRAVFLTLGTGIGSSFLEDGLPVSDLPGIPPHGHVYLLEWDGQPIERTVSRRALIKGYENAAGRHLDVREIATEARGGDPDAIAVIDAAFHALGACVGPPVAAFAADVIVIGGSIARSWDLVQNSFSAGLAETAPSVADGSVHLARAPLESPLIGAARAAQLLRSATAP